MTDATEEIPAVQLDRSSARYRGRGADGVLALDDISLTVRPGEIVAVLGANGAGKSTLLRLVAGLVSPSAGAVRVLGHPIPRGDRRGFARALAFVPQSEPPAVGFRVREVVAMGRAPHQDLWMSERPEDAAAVARALERCDLTPLADRRVETLSGGELRRVAIARALAQGPRVLLLDEPAAFLDVRHRLELGALLASVSREDRIACLVAMHELSAAASLASQALLLKAGRVVACGRPAEVLTREHLAVAFDADVRPGRDGPTGEPYFVVARGGV